MAIVLAGEKDARMAPSGGPCMFDMRHESRVCVCVCVCREYVQVVFCVCCVTQSAVPSVKSPNPEPSKGGPG